MKIVYEVSTTNYEDDKKLLIEALEHLQTNFQVDDGYQLSKPLSRFGWTFFKLWLKPTLQYTIEKKFSDMIEKAKGDKPQEKFTNFIIDFFESRGCKIKLKLIED